MNDGEPGRPLVTGMGAVVSYGLLVSAGMVWLWLRDRTEMIAATAAGEFGLVPAAAIGVAVGCSIFGLLVLFSRYVRALVQLENRLKELLGELSEVQVLVIALCSGLGEEFFFRLAMQDAIGLGWTTAVFALLHIGPRGTRSLVVFAAAVGFLFGLMMELGCGLLSVTMAHTLSNYLSLQRMNQR